MNGLTAIRIVSFVLVLLLPISPTVVKAAPISLNGLSGEVYVYTPTVGEFHSSAFTDAASLNVLGFGGLFDVVASGDTINITFIVDVPAFNNVTFFQLDLANVPQMFPVTSGAPVVSFGVGSGCCTIGGGFPFSSVSLEFSTPGSFGNNPLPSYKTGDTILLSLDDETASVFGAIGGGAVAEPSTLILLASSLGGLTGAAWRARRKR